MWIVLVLAGAMIGMFIPFFLVSPADWSVIWIDLILALLTLWLILDLLLCTRYTIDGTTLKIRCSIVRESCHIGSISEIKESRTWLSSPALSLDRIQIKYGKYGTIVISPLEKEKFIAELCAINPNIKVVYKN